MNVLLSKLLDSLEKSGVLLLSDQELPNVASILAGEPIRGSWWGHPKGNLIYNLSSDLADRPDVLTLKLINKKVTYLAKRYWNDLFTVGLSKQEWQLKGLSKKELDLLSAIQKKGKLRSDDPSLKISTTEVGKLSTKLEIRLLCYSESIHTESGKHVRLLMSWKSIMKQKKYKLKKTTPAVAMNRLEQLAANFSNNKAAAKLPWA